MSVEDRLREFIDAGYRPTVQTHALRYKAWLVEEDGYAVLSGIHDLWAEADAEPGEVIPTESLCIGWIVNAKDVTGLNRQDILGGTFPHIDEAIEYSLLELAKYRGDR